MSHTQPMSMMNDLQRQQFENERKILLSLQHQNIIKIEDYFILPTAYCIVLEYMAGGDLMQRIRNTGGVAELTGKVMFKQLTEAVTYLHHHKIVHRDLKPDNILLADYEEYTVIKVTDFGLSKSISDQNFLQTFCGTMAFAAPEILSGQGFMPYTASVDIWSMGVILYSILGGCLPFTNQRSIPFLEQIQLAHFNFDAPAFDEVSLSAKQLILKMIETQPRKRIDLDAISASQWLEDEKMKTIIEGITQNRKELFLKQMFFD